MRHRCRVQGGGGRQSYRPGHRVTSPGDRSRSPPSQRVNIVSPSFPLAPALSLLFPPVLRAAPSAPASLIQARHVAGPYRQWFGLLLLGLGGITGCTGPFRDCAINLAASISLSAMFSPMVNNLVFVSSARFPTSLGSAMAYDAKCNAAATTAGINDSASASYIAFTSDASSNAATRLGSARGWVRMDGQPFADTTTPSFQE